MAARTKAPDDPWPEAAPGLEIQLLPGIHGPVEFSGAPDMAILGGEGVVIEGSISPGGGEPECSMRFHDGCDRLQILGPLEVWDSRGRGIRITRAADIQLADLYIHHCSIEGIITGDCDGASYRNITVEDSRQSPDSSVARQYPPDKRHGLYVSGNADGSEVRGLTVRRVTGSGLQANGAGMDAIITNLGASELVFEHCGSGGTPPISLMAVQDSTIERFCEDWTAGDRWAVCFDDGKGREYACHNVVFRDYTVPRGTECAKEGGSTGIVCDPGPGWSPETPVPPEPEPPQPPAYDPEHDLDILHDAFAAIQREARAGQAAVARLEAGLAGGQTYVAPAGRAG
jgi:hypothetical protein